VDYSKKKKAQLIEKIEALQEKVAELEHALAERKRTEQELRPSYAVLRRTLDGTVHALAAIAEERDPFAVGHHQRVARLACAIAKEMGLPEEQIEGLRVAGLIHDIGEISIPLEVLSKPTKLTELEDAMMKAHPRVSHDIVKAAEFPWPVAQIVLQHHERLDGSGYPQGLSGEEIILEARILAVADVVMTIVSHRPHQRSRGLDKALEEISQNKGVFYDPEVIDACLKLFAEKGFEFE
jgi:putative nucleotidyltransferase with HDIG domain